MKLVVMDTMVGAEAIWRQLEASGACSYYQTYDWLSAWQQHVGENAAVSPRIVRLSDDRDNVLALLPFGLRSRSGGKSLHWLGHDVSSYLGPILTPDGVNALDHAALDAVFSMLPEHGLEADYVDLDKQPAFLGDHANPFASYKSDPTGLRSHVTHLAGDWDAYYAKKRSSKTRQKDRNRLKQMRQHGEVAFKIASSPEEIQSLTERLISEKTRQFHKLGAKNIFEDNRVADLFRDVALRSADKGVKLFAITLSGDPIAIAYCAIHRDEFHGIFLCYMENEVTRLGPGTVLLHEIFEWCFKNGIRTFDFSVGDQSYKDHWCETSYPLYRSFWPVTPLGMLSVQPMKMAMRLKAKVKSSETFAQLARRLPRRGKTAAQ